MLLIKKKKRKKKIKKIKKSKEKLDKKPTIVCWVPEQQPPKAQKESKKGIHKNQPVTK